MIILSLKLEGHVSASVALLVSDKLAPAIRKGVARLACVGMCLSFALSQALQA
jgi:hypothetical protein